MKKITALFFLFIIIYLNNSKLETVSVEKYLIEKEKQYLLTNFDPKINTNNINKYIKQEDIKEIIPYINPLYKEKIKHEFNKYINDNMLNNALENYIYDYNNILEKYTIKKDNINYQINGYPIESIIVNNVNNIKNLHYDIKTT